MIGYISNEPRSGFSSFPEGGRIGECYCMQMRKTIMLDRLGSENVKLRRKRVLAFTIVGLMIVSTLVIAVPAILQMGGAPQDEVPVNIKANNGQREATYTIDHMFEVYMKDQDFEKSAHNNGIGVTADELGHHNTTMGWMEWLNNSAGNSPRQTGYGEITLRNNYPYLVNTWPYAQTTPELDIGMTTWAPFRLSATVKNETMCGTGEDVDPTKDALFIPHLGPTTVGGGYINISWYGTYMTKAELENLSAGTYFGNWFYGCPDTYSPNPTSNDGYYYEMHGTMEYSAQALRAYLNWDDVTYPDARDYFNATASTIMTNWNLLAGQGWRREGGNTGPYDIYTGYEYSFNVYPIGNNGAYTNWLSLDVLNSTSTNLIIRLYHCSWGMDALICRYLEAANLTGSFGQMESNFYGTVRLSNRGVWQDYGEDMYLNLSISPNMVNATYRQTCLYHLTAWEDPSASTFSGTWMLEMMHLDYCGNTIVPPHQRYKSPYDKYDPDYWSIQVPPEVRSRLSLSPGTMRYGQNVSYWIAPEVRNLSQYEKIIVSIDTNGRDVIGILPYVAANDVRDNIKMNDLMQNHTYWGRLKLGDGCLPRTEIRNGYDPEDKVITLEGPMEYTLTHGVDYWNDYANGRVYAYGVPLFIFNVVKVDYYDVVVAGPHMVGLKDTVTITAKNASGATVTDWNGSISLDCNDSAAVLDSSSHAFILANNGQWQTNVTWGTAGVYTINVTDDTYLDISGAPSTPVGVVIPEFPAILIPVVGTVGLLLLMRTRSRHGRED